MFLLFIIKKNEYIYCISIHVEIAISSYSNDSVGSTRIYEMRYYLHDRNVPHVVLCGTHYNESFLLF
ncbi:hypothetical protein RIR_jg29034.t1 [Rhizophagus irregularis DAOM 181602=DAOM 197198]|nr:hypothetical protein RIR_jg29034.t1 [Rhizophagus irregularis DAOM 181602=DAOM 197198]